MVLTMFGVVQVEVHRPMFVTFYQNQGMPIVYQCQYLVGVSMVATHGNVIILDDKTTTDIKLLTIHSLSAGSQSSVVELADIVNSQRSVVGEHNSIAIKLSPNGKHNFLRMIAKTFRIRNSNKLENKSKEIDRIP